VAGCVYAIAHVDLELLPGDPKAATPSSICLWRLDCAEVAKPIWEALPPAPTPRFGFGAVAFGGRLVIAGGEDPTAPSVIGVVEVFDPVQREWSRLSPMPTARSCPSLVAHEGLLFAIGGCGDVYDCGADVVDPNWPSRVVEAYDPAAGAWMALPDIPEPLVGQSSCHLPPMVLAL